MLRRETEAFVSLMMKLVPWLGTETPTGELSKAGRNVEPPLKLTSHVTLEGVLGSSLYCWTVVAVETSLLRVSNVSQVMIAAGGAPPVSVTGKD